MAGPDGASFTGTVEFRLGIVAKLPLAATPDIRGQVISLGHYLSIESLSGSMEVPHYANDGRTANCFFFLKPFIWAYYIGLTERSLYPGT